MRSDIVLCFGEAFAHGPEYALLRAPHTGGRVRTEVVEAIQVEQSMDDVKGDLDLHLLVVARSVLLCCLRADCDFAVLKCQHIGRSLKAHEVVMQACNGGVGDNDHGNFMEVAQSKTAIARKRLATRKCVSRSAANPSEIEPDAALAIRDEEFQVTK